MGVPNCTEVSASPTFIDVFAGCGGLSLGLKRAGWNGLFAIEKDAFAFQTLSNNFDPNHSRLSFMWPESIEKKAWDIHDLISSRENELKDMSGQVDLLAGGPPCQGFSAAGRRRLEDPRNKLFETYLELVGILQPQIVLIENVRGFTSDFKIHESDKTKNFSNTLQRELGRSYNVASKIIQSRDFGLPQTRPRFFLVGVRKELDKAEQISSFFHELEQQSETHLRARNLPLRPTSRDAISDLEISRNGTMPSIESKGFHAIAYRSPLTSYQKAMREGCEAPPGDTRLARHRPHIQKRFAEIIQHSKRENRLNVTISMETRKRYGLKKMAIRVLDPDDRSPTITSLPDDLLHYSEPRTLTVRETARLQSFPDWFEFKGSYTTGGHRRRVEVPRFTQVANAVPPLLAEQLGKQLLKYIEFDTM